MNENEAIALHNAMEKYGVMITSADGNRQLSFRYRWETWGSNKKYERKHLIEAGAFELCLNALIGDVPEKAEAL